MFILRIILAICALQSSALFSVQFDRVKILIQTFIHFRGEEEFARRLIIAASNLGWDAEINIYDPKHPKSVSSDYKFVINLYGRVPKIPGVRNYVVIFHPDIYLFDNNGYLKNDLIDFDGYLITFSNIEKIKEQFTCLGRPFHYMKWYPTVYQTPYRTVFPKKLAYICSQWGNRKDDMRYQTLFKLLDKANYCNCYGSLDNERLYPNSYRGTIPYDGVSVINKYSLSGVNLVMHSDLHNHLGMPSSRIFEAAASSSVIISDLNPYVLENFGDSVLYYDQSKDGYTMFKQINRHMEWILSNPEEALNKARQSYQILQEKYLLEDQLLNLLEMDGNIL